MRGRKREKSPERAREISRVSSRAHYAKRRIAYLDLKRGKVCGRCGYDDYRALAFHHVDPTTKLFPIAAKYWIVSWEKVLAEVEKCELICANCHAIEHHERRDQSLGQRIPDDPNQLVLKEVL